MARWGKAGDSQIGYDDLYRVISVDSQYASGDDSWTSPFEAEDSATETDPHRPLPSPHQRFDRRPLRETYSYDWLGNQTQTDDDAHGFYERSLGTITNGTSSAGPYQLRAASNRSSAAANPSHKGDLDAAYDDAGNLTDLIVRRDGSCLPIGASCFTRLAYNWDEVGRLAAASRWDLAEGSERSSHGTLTSTPPARDPDVKLVYSYDADDGRVRKTATSPQRTEVHTLYPLVSLELHRSDWTGSDYVLDAQTETVYLAGGGLQLGRVVHEEADVPSLTSGRRHAFLELGDQLGSNAIVIDLDTGELVERTTYQAYGNVESDYRPERWNSFRESHQFTGKEDDIEVGLVYFGKRYYAPSLGRWVSADPLTIHRMGADLNAYAYVNGRTFVATDPSGLHPLVAALVIGAIVGAVVGGGANAYHQYQGKQWVGRI